MLKRINFLTAGESHGKGLLGIIDGLPSNLEISSAYINSQLSRRQKGHGRSARMKIEHDQAEIYCGVRNQKTSGAPIGLIIENLDYKNWKNIMTPNKIESSNKKISLPRPGHADLAGIQKYDLDDIRDVIERSSARETAMRVGLGSIARKMLEDIGINVGSRVVQIYTIRDTSSLSAIADIKDLNKIADKSPVRCLTKEIEKEMMSIIDESKKSGDSIGGSFEVIVSGVPYGLGSYVQWDRKLHARLSAVIMSINAFKGIQFGDGFSSCYKKGSQVHDEIFWKDNKYDRGSNNAGGIEGGISNGQNIVMEIGMKPIPTLIKPLKSVDINTKENKLAHKERTDSCAVPAASIIAESMVCIGIADAILEKFGGDSMEQLKSHIKATAKY